MKDAILRAVEELAGTITGISRDLHRDPELSEEESRASALLQEKLAAAGFRVEVGSGGLPTAFMARLPGSASSPRVAILAEYDALPGIGHGCGHNLIAAAGVGAGLVLARAAGREGLPGEVLVIGTPAEETIGGKAVMVRAGVFDRVDAAMMIHPSYEWRVHVDSLACVSLQVTFLGKESHAVARPEMGINALDALIRFYLAVETLVESLGPEVRIPGIIQEGGLRPNMVPARAVGWFTLRAPTTACLLEVREAFEKVAGATADAHRCGLEIEPTDNLYDDLLTNRAMAGRFKKHLASMKVRTEDGPRENKGSLDMGNVSRAVPSIHPFIAVADASIPIHSEGFARASLSPRAEEALLTAVRALALTASDLIAEPDLLRQAKTEFAEDSGGGEKE